LGNLEEGLSTGDFERSMKAALGMEFLSLKRPRGGGLMGSSFTGDPGRKSPGTGISFYRGPFLTRGERGVGGGGGARIPGTLKD